MIDRLEQIFQLQKYQQLNWLDLENLTDDERDRFLRDLSLFMIDEILEFQRARSYKRHKIWEDQLPRSEQILELVDVAKYLITSLLTLGVNSQEFYEAFLKKTEVVEERWRQDKAKWETSQSKIVCVDIDDVLADYASYLDDFRLIHPELSDQEIKCVLEEDGHFSNLQPIRTNVDVVKKLVDNGYHIVLMTSRRVWRISNLYNDTITWLKVNGIQFETILWSYDKAEEITKRLRNVKPIFAAENSLKHAIDIADMGIKTYYISQNEIEYPNIISIPDLSCIDEIAEVNSGLYSKSS